MFIVKTRENWVKEQSNVFFLDILQLKRDMFFFFLIDKEKNILTRGAKRTTQGIQYPYTPPKQQKEEKAQPNQRG